MRVLLIGAGRYGNSLVGRKYVNGELGAKLIGVVDPKIEEIKKSDDYCLQGVPTYRTIDEVSKACIQDCVSDIALIPQIVPDTFMKLVNSGAKKVILPKPVSTNSKDFQEMLNVTESKKVDALVASNWHYSNITKMTKALIAKLTGEEIDSSVKLPEQFTSKLNDLSSGYKITRAEVQYNKQNEVLTIDPPMQELPHALQIVYSTGCTNLKDVELFMDKHLQTKSRVNVELQNVKDVKDGIKLNSDLQMHEKLDKKRERILKVFMEKNGEKVVVTSDYDAVFDKMGHCLKRPSISYECLGAPETNWKYEINEDNMNVMYRDMFGYIQGEQNGSLTMEKYNPISDVLCKVQRIWEKTKV